MSREHRSDDAAPAKAAPLPDAPSSGAGPASSASPGSQRWRRRLMALGMVRATCVLTGISVLASALMAGGAMYWAQLNAESFRFGLIMSMIVPGLVAPTVVSMVMPLLFEVERAHAQLQRVASRDALTQAYNRRYFMEQLDTAVARSQRTGESLSLLMIDADHFKSVNDAHGHAIGDQVLCELARTAGANLRPDDVLARYGGEEFVVLLPDLDLAPACEIAERIRLATEALQVRTPGDVPVPVTVSIGVCSLAPRENLSKLLLDEADRALYRAKRAGRNRCAFAALAESACAPATAPVVVTSPASSQAASSRHRAAASPADSTAPSPGPRSDEHRPA